MPVVVLPDAGKVAQYWAKNDVDIAAATKGQISNIIPKREKWRYPFWLRFQVIDGGSEIALPRARYIVQWDVYAVTLAENPDLPKASEIMRVVASKAMDVKWNQTLVTEAGAYVQSNNPILGPRPEPDEPVGWGARYRMDTELVFVSI